MFKVRGARGITAVILRVAALSVDGMRTGRPLFVANVHAVPAGHDGCNTRGGLQCALGGEAPGAGSMTMVLAERFPFRSSLAGLLRG